MTPVPDTAAIPRPRLIRRLWIPGLQYDGETSAQMDVREARYREEDRLADAEEQRLWRWKTTPWWQS